MLHFFALHFKDWLEHHRLGFFRVFVSIPFQATLSFVLGFLFCILLGPPVIAWLRRMKIDDKSAFDQPDSTKTDSAVATGPIPYWTPTSDQPNVSIPAEPRRNVPTMGGIFIIASITATVLLLGNLGNFYVLMGLLCLIWLGAVGAIDDWLKLTVGRRNNSRQGLTSREKLLFQIGLGILLSYFTWEYGKNAGISLHFPFLKSYKIPLNLGCFILISTIVMIGSSNAVNLTDGVDGLAAGVMAIVSLTFCVLALIIGNQHWASHLHLPYVQATHEMAVLAGAMAGACIGFLWFNCNPASVFMGDTGSLAMGGLLGYIAIVVRQELLLFLIGGIFVVEALSVMIQVSYFKYTRIRFGEGRRVFLKSPLHHHFQKKGWTDTQVVVRFWLISAMLAAMALATIKLR